MANSIISRCTFINTSDPLQPECCKLSVLLTFRINITLILRLENFASREHLVIIRSYLISHLPRLVAMFFMCELKVSNLINFLVTLFLYFIFIDNHDIQHNMLKERPVATG